MCCVIWFLEHSTNWAKYSELYVFDLSYWPLTNWLTKYMSEWMTEGMYDRPATDCPLAMNYLL